MNVNKKGSFHNKTIDKILNSKSSVLRDLAGKMGV